MRHAYIGTEHLLLGLMREEGGVAGRVLRDLGVEQRRVQEMVERLTGASAGRASTVSKIDLAPGTKKVLELAVDEARRMGHHYIGTEHLLLGLMRRSEGTAMEIFRRLNVTPEEVRRQTRRVLQESPVKARAPERVTPPQPPVQSEARPQATLPNLLTNAAAHALMLASNAAATLGQGYVGNWHLLLGLTRDDATGSRVLRVLGVDEAKVEGIIR